MSPDELIEKAIAAPTPEEALVFLGHAADMTRDETGVPAARIHGLLGYMQHQARQLDKARVSFDKAERLWDGIPAFDKPERRAATLCNHANLLCDLGDYPGARQRMEAALELDRQTLGPEHIEYARTIANYGRLLLSMGAAEEATYHVRRAIEILAKSGEPRAQEALLHAKNFLAQALVELGSWKVAIDLFKEVAAAAEESGDWDLHYSALNNVGWALYRVGDFAQAAVWQRRALEALRTNPKGVDRIDEATVLTNLGTLEHKAEDFEAACRTCEEAARVLKVAVPDGSHPQMATIEANWGIALMRLGRYGDARPHYEKALALREAIDGADHPMTADVRFHLAEVTWGDGTPEKTVDEALAVLGMPGLYANPDRTWRVFDLLCRALGAQGRTPFAILMGKEAVAILESMRSGLAGLGRQADDLFARSRAIGYRDLADQLVVDYRLAEAEHALTRLRAAEQNELLGHNGGPQLTAQPGFSRQEEDWRARYVPSIERIGSLRQQLGDLPGTGDAEAERARLHREIAEAAKAVVAAVGGLLGEEMAVPVTRARAVPAEEMGKPLHTDEILLHFFPADSHLWVLRRDASGNAVRQRIDADEPTVNRMVLEFRHAVSNPYISIDAVKATSLRLYDLLLRPVLGDALEQGARLSFWLDGALRFLPPAALFDGARYLVEKAPASLYTPFDGPVAKRRGLSSSGVAGFALGHPVPGFAPLAFAVSEVETVVGDRPGQGLFTGERFLDGKFTPAALKEAAARFGGLLIATHFVLHPADLAGSGLLTGTGELMPVREIAGLDFRGASLVTISGCDTGTAGLDDDAAMLQSLADRLMVRGAGAVMASLWRVADEGAARLVTEFYRNLAQGDDADFPVALAAAQCSMLRDGGAAPGWTTFASRGIGSAADEDHFVGDELDFRHPCYWAPFVLLGGK